MGVTVSSTVAYSQTEPMILQDFTDPELRPRFFYGIVRDAGKIVEDSSGERFFRFDYVQPRQGVRPSHSGYRMKVAPLLVEGRSQVTFRYRTDQITDLRMGLFLSNQQLGLAVTLTPSPEWTSFSIPLAERYNQDITGVTTQELSLITFAPQRGGSPQSFLELDDFQLELSEKTDIGKMSVYERIQKSKADMEALEKYIRIDDVLMSQDVYKVGEPIAMTYNLINTLPDTLAVPLNKDYSRDFYLIGLVQAYIVPVKPSGAMFAAGGSIVPIGKDFVAPREEFSRRGQYKKNLAPGHYEWRIEFKQLRSGQILDYVTTPFEVRK